MPRPTRNTTQTAPKGTQSPRKAPRKPPAPPPAPKPPVTVEIASDIPHHNPSWFPPPPTTTTDAHHTTDPTPCRVCGGPVDPTSTYWGPWRQHDPCALIAASPPHRLAAAAITLGVTALDPGDAALIGYRATCYHETHPEPTWENERTRDRMPWRHLDRKQLVRAVADLPRLRREAGIDPAACTDGPCAWCGVIEATGWTSTDLTWADGGPAPMCGDCHPIYVKHGVPTFIDDVRPALAEAITGVPPMIGEHVPARLVPFIDAAGKDSTCEVFPGEPWGHLNPEAVDAYRWAQWGRWGGQYAPPEHRTEAVARAAAAEQSRADTIAARERDEAERANTYGF